MNRIPEWANWLARDKDGCLYAYSDKPTKKNMFDIWSAIGASDFLEAGDTNYFSSVKWEDENPTQVGVPKNCENDLVNKPKHYQNKEGKDLFQKWYEQHDLETYRHIMRAIAERYTSRYENKNGLEDLEKGIYTLQRLKEVEQAEKESDFERVGKLIETYHAGTNPND